MRVKQTARKSTASGPYSGYPRANSHVMNDPARTRMQALLQTKRKSATPSASNVTTRSVSNAAGIGKGKRISIYQSDLKANVVKIKPRLRPGQGVLKEIKILQKGWDMLIPRAPFHRLVREITQEIQRERNEEDDSVRNESQIRFQTAALQALQEATEHYLVRMFEDSYLCCLHAKRVTLFVQDMQLCRRIQGTR